MIAGGARLVFVIVFANWNADAVLDAIYREHPQGFF
jgi:hypothetical protein